MKKLFVSADIEGTAGILDWRETEKNSPEYAYFAEQMTREAAAACEGAYAAGYDDILLRDAHDSARNLLPDKLPEYVRILRGWAKHPYCMMFGLDSSFGGVVFTGYHSAAGWDSNPLAHTMTTALAQVTVNGEIASELMLNAMTATLEDVPVFAVTGDEGLCRWMQKVSPGTAVVPVSRGLGAASLSIHPREAVRRIRETVQEAVTYKKEDCLFPLPDRFHITIDFKDHALAYSHSFYPGVTTHGARTLSFDSTDYRDVLRMMHFVM